MKKTNLVKKSKAPATPAGSDPMLSAPLRLVEVDRILPGENARAEVGDVSALARSMAKVGLLQPIVVRGDGAGWVLVAGARRLAAAKQLGWTSIRASILEGAISEAHAASLAENVSRVDLSPFEESAALLDLLGGSAPDEALELAAGKLGIPMRRARRRLALADLEGSWRKAYAKGEATLDALELLASVPAASRKGLRFYGQRITRQEVARALRNGAMDIAAAPFDASACAQCMHRIGLVPDLFDASDSMGKQGRCTKQTCWDEKAAEALRAKVEKARKRHPDLVVKAHELELRDRPALKKLAKELGAGEHPEFYGCAKGDKGALPVISLAGMDAGKVVWKRPFSSSRSEADKKPQTEKEKAAAKEIAADRKAARTKARMIYELPAWESDPVEAWARKMLTENPGKAVALVLLQAEDRLEHVEETLMEQAVEAMSRHAHSLVNAWAYTNKSNPLDFKKLEALLEWLDLPKELQIFEAAPAKTASKARHQTNHPTEAELKAALDDTTTNDAACPQEV